MKVLERIRNIKTRWKIAAAIVAVLLVVFWFILPDPLFSKPYASVLLDRNGRLLQARIAPDGQWRFPHDGDIPEKFSKALITFEDKRFEYHPGVDPIALSRAVWQNATRRKVISGGSTLSMQVIRLSRNKPRNLWQKLLEIILSVRLELSYSKKEILALYAGHAPFGGNVVGIDAASWRYFGRDASQLSWGEAASLAILPNNPSMVRPDRNRDILLSKRNRLLDAMQREGIIDEQTCALSKLEPMPDKPLPLPEEAPHLLASLRSGKLKQQDDNQPLIHSTIDGQLQQRLNRILYRHHEQFAANGINNAAAMIMEVNSGKVLAYAGNVYRPDKPGYDSYVDVIPAPRSPGSTLKPLLYAAMLQDGLLLPHTLVADIPTQVAGYSPQNFDLGYDGAVPAGKALARSLNVPAVRMLQQYRIERFYELLKKLGIKTLTQPSGHYGLSLILGGGENSMWELCGVYSSLARMLNHYGQYNGRYDPADVRMPLVTGTSPAIRDHSEWANLPAEFMLGAGALYHTFNAMTEVMRPGEEQLWTQFTSSQKVAWKTGTSFGFRDGWAIGLTPGHVVAVWVGNADGEGRPGLTGINAAAPVMFELFRMLPASSWFPVPYDDLTYVTTCSKSGFIATDLCGRADSLLVPVAGARSGPCPFHHLIHLDALGTSRVNSECESPSNMRHTGWFVLPPAMEWYYKNHDHTYRSLPPWRKDCAASAGQGTMMEMIYPKRSNTIYVPVELDGKAGKCVFEVAHRNKETTIYWHLDETFIGSTREFHQMALNPLPGKHTLVLVDENGERLEQYVEIISR
jgi:penicillin-binding protein 1C